MKKVLVGVLIVLALLLLVGCFIGKYVFSYYKDPKVFYQEGRILEITDFSWHVSEMSTDNSFSAKKNGDGAQITCRLFPAPGENDTMNFYVDVPVMEELGKIAGEYGLDRWDGFDKTNEYMVDGSSFSLSMTLADSTKISAHGSNRFPKEYSEVKDKIDELFWQLIDKYRED